MRMLRISYYGNLLHYIPSADALFPIPFNPINDINLALERRGFYPEVKVTANLLLPKHEEITGTTNTNDTTETSSDDLEEMYHHFHSSDDEGSDDEVSIADSLSADKCEMGDDKEELEFD